MNLMRVLLAVACVLLLSACDETTAPKADTSKANPALNAGDVEWRSHGLSSDEQRYSSLSQINRDTVKQLGLEWSFDLYTRRGVEATPLMINRTLYVTGSWSMVYALDATSGELKWFYDPQVDRSFLSKGCCDAVNRGVAFHDGKIFVGTYDGRLVALDADNGQVIWDVQTTDRNQSYTITGAPRIVKDKVVIGNGGAELGVRGYVSAYEAASGEMAWRFYTVPGNPADGFENDAMRMAAATWTGEWWKWGGGGTVWDSMVYDPELELLYVGVGNGSPWNHKIRSPDGGDNLFLSSIVAVKPDTGEYVWHYQTTPGETWDYTSTQHLMLADLDIDGERRKVVMQAPKNGFFYVIDRITGELISAEKYSLVTWASHIDLQSGRPVETPNARVFDGKNVSLPSNAGAHNWPPMSYNPNTGLVYIPSMIFPVRFLDPTDEQDRQPKQGLWNVGFDRIANVPPALPNLDELLEKEYTGTLLAWDPITQKVKWQLEPSRPTGGGTLSSAGQLVFQGGKTSHFNAYDAETGEELWSWDVQTGAMAAPVTYEIEGEQYIAVAVGFGGGFAAEGGPVAHAWEVPNISRVLVFKLGGEHQLPELSVAEKTLLKPASVTASLDVVEQGKVVFHRHCAYCHGDGFRTGGINPDLRYSSEAIHAIWDDIVRGGILKGAGMVSFADYVDEDQAEAVRQYVLSEANRLYQQESQQPVTQ
ncbi:MAG: PQQ-dependent dehydrogenase, methanol/ethanol family [Cellvibrionaceae bacterium]|nr:PQQ-dependent dehydrogenase, methanol/ethanol family [Cellvibrionaceae bacterium]